MNLQRIVLLGVLGMVFSSALLSANVLIAADQTVMDADYAADTADEAKLHGSLEGEIERQIQANDSVDTAALPIDRSVDDILADSITSDYVRTQVEANMDRFYAYLDGDRETLTLEIETEPVVQNVLDELEPELETLRPSDFDETLANVGSDEMAADHGTAIEEMTESESQFLAHRQAFEERVKERIQEETPFPMTDEQLDREYENRREDIRADLIATQDEQLAAAVEDGTLPASFEAPVRTIMTARIDALTGEIGYDSYVTAVETGMDDLRAAALDEAETRLREEVPSTIDLTEDFGSQERSSMETAQRATGLAGTLTMVLPLVALGAAAIVALRFPPAVAARSIGLGAAVVGLVSLVGARVTEGAVGSAIDDADGPEAALQFVRLLFEGLFGMLTWQSAGLLVVGLGLVGVSVAIQRGLALADD
ncbi:hypothetical protein C479_13853 [Halovivax asiaticus JCM 14624]|uniref:Uncharacterized protein n=1 Tax=Halovivax asiaticus JCM 14624 TaxID=1227490 RepID=M0BDP9_9EURY|nr:hypothetical protein [Halovivax asiaticus]ELZ08428.1 hypothetical protein C479_13853 [Halovivax asiaticus JCM 14624]